ncbi:MAG TPA: hypothetical protein VGC13_22390 [Longimicrobium sp.]|uniref:hypothetical protein n=1 Tax=Longimicrobium sp. TaxID=2029185 RepID=UPI002ED9EE04
MSNTDLYEPLYRASVAEGHDQHRQLLEITSVLVRVDFRAAERVLEALEAPGAIPAGAEWAAARAELAGRLKSLIDEGRFVYEVKQRAERDERARAARRRKEDRETARLRKEHGRTAAGLERDLAARVSSASGTSNTRMRKVGS